MFGLTVLTATNTSEQMKANNIKDFRQELYERFPDGITSSSLIDWLNEHEVHFGVIIPSDSCFKIEIEHMKQSNRSVVMIIVWSEEFRDAGSTFGDANYGIEMFFDMDGNFIEDAIDIYHPGM